MVPGVMGRVEPHMRLICAALLAAQVAVAAPPSPESHFGHPIGVDRTLLDWDKVVGYFRALEKTSGRIRVEEIGKTVEGRPMIAAFISNEQTVRELERYRLIQSALSDARKTTEAEAERLITQGKAVVMITCSIHATEVASTHSAVEFAYRILTEDKSKFRRILDNVIFILVPSLNPDGVDIVTRWYRKTLGTPLREPVRPSCTSTTWGTTTTGTGTSFRNRKRGRWCRGCTICGIRKSSMTCTSRDHSPHGCSCPHGWTRSTRTSTPP